MIAKIQGHTRWLLRCREIMCCDHHTKYISDAKHEYSSFQRYLGSTEFGKTSIDKYFFAMVARCCETIESMFQNTKGAPDNTLIILLRNLFETTVRIRFLAQNPHVNIKFFEIAEATGRINIIGREDGDADTEDRIREREKLKKNIHDKREELKDALEIGINPPNLGVEMMCDALGETENYRIYRVLSQYEHSNGMGLIGTVIDSTSGAVAIGGKMERKRVKIVWEFVITMLRGIREAVDMLNSHRPTG